MSAPCPSPDSRPCPPHSDEWYEWANQIVSVVNALLTQQRELHNSLLSLQAEVASLRQCCQPGA